MSKAYISVALRKEVISRANHFCEYCQNLDAADIHAYHMDHIYNEAKGGLTDLENLAYACADCNQRKSENLAGYLPDLKLPFIFYHPRKDKREDHFLLRSTGVIEFFTNAARATSAQLEINQEYKVTQRAVLIRSGLLVADEA